MYAWSDKATGPWDGKHKRPDLALGSGRANLPRGKIVYVAHIEPIKPSDGLPNILALVGEVRENLVDKYGSGADDFFDNPKLMGAFLIEDHRIKQEFDKFIDGIVDVGFVAPVTIRAYNPDRHVKAGDFEEI